MRCSVYFDIANLLVDALCYVHLPGSCSGGKGMQASSWWCPVSANPDRPAEDEDRADHPGRDDDDADDGHDHAEDDHANADVNIKW